MRHWLASVLARERPALFRDLPESFKVGHPLPAHPSPAYDPLPSDGRGTQFQSGGRGSAALPQIKNGRADLPVSPNIRDAQQSVPPSQPVCPRLQAAGDLDGLCHTGGISCG